jgi:hypothetical protein
MFGYSPWPSPPPGGSTEATRHPHPSFCTFVLVLSAIISMDDDTGAEARRFEPWPLDDTSGKPVLGHRSLHRV